MVRDVPGVFEGVARGEFAPVTEWLGEKIHKYQKVYLPLDILKNATGEELHVAPYLDYLNKKFGDLYGF